jgi:hypothetical protein
MMDRRHVTWVVTAALTPTPQMFTFTKEDFLKKIQLEPIVFRAQQLLKSDA